MVHFLDMQLRLTQVLEENKSFELLSLLNRAGIYHDNILTQLVLNFKVFWLPCVIFKHQAKGSKHLTKIRRRFF